jgi:hypothetical protein
MTEAGSFFLKTVLVCWAVLIPAKVWGGRKGDSWLRRFVMLVIGAGVGVGALWLDGWMPRSLPPDFTALVEKAPTRATFLGLEDATLQLVMYLTYFGVVLFAVRWWKMAGPRRKFRFSLFPLLAVGFWSLILLLVWKPMMGAALVLIAASLVVQLVSPWEGPSVPVARKIRPRWA